MTFAAQGGGWSETPVVFECEGDRLVGIATEPQAAHATGVLIVVGGPQYRAGSHRQFTLLARQLAQHGIPAFRFDYRGMGDSEGEPRNFEGVDADVRSAIDAFMRQVPSLRQVVVWGLCDAASAATYYGHADARVAGLALANPWVHSPAGAARAKLKHYYLRRLLQRSFWTKLLSGKVQVGASLGDLRNSAKLANGESGEVAAGTAWDPRHGQDGYVERMLQGLRRFEGRVLLLLSGNDLTAQEFIDLLGRDRQWRKQFDTARATRHTLAAANHTFSTQAWRDQVGQWTAAWVAGMHDMKK